MTKEGNTHVDAPTSSGTRNNKDGCVGKIVLARKVVKRDVKDGIVGYCEGISGTVSLIMWERVWLINRVIGRGLYGSSEEGSESRQPGNMYGKYRGRGVQ